MKPRAFVVVALASLIALMVLSAAFGVVRVHGAAPGFVLAAMKVLVLGFVADRVRRTDNYTMQWSSMFILLFMAEGTVRAMSDPQPQAAMGALEAVLATVYFVAVLAYLRPLKQAAKRPAPPKDAPKR